MSETKVENQDFEKRPVLLVVVVLDEVNFEFLKLLQTLRQLGDDEESQVKYCMNFWEVVDYQNEKAHKVDYHVVFTVIHKDLLKSRESFPRLRFNSHAVVPDLEQIENNT